MAQLTPVQEYYKGKTVFITGASGFMGKVLLEKLLYSCSELKEIIIMLRPKRGKVPETRLEEMFKIPIFQRIKDEKPEVLKKVSIVQGDVTFDSLGLGGDSLQKIIDKTNIIFHMAATLKLEGNLKDAIDMNTSGTKRVLDIAKKMQNLEALVHLSTAFCNCDQEVMYEKVYEFQHKPEDLMRLAEWMDMKTLDNITPDLLKPHPNTYTYSKRLAELLVRDHYPSLPVIIARPSIVTPAFAEPLPGWVDNMNGPTGVMIGAGKGVIRSMICNGELKSEVIPVDIAINGLIVLPYHYARLDKKPERVPVFNITCSENKKKTWKWIMEVGQRFACEYPFEVGLWYPDGTITTNKLYHWFLVVFFMWLPAYLIDFLLLIFRQKRFMVRVQTKIATGLEMLQFFTTRRWDFKSDNFMRAFSGLKEKDREMFNMSTDDLDDMEYMKSSFIGGRVYVMKEPLSSLPRARTQIKFLYALDLICKVAILGSLLYWVFLKLELNTLIYSSKNFATVESVKT